MDHGIKISNEITYNIFEGGKVGAANEMRVKCDHNCNKLDTLLVNAQSPVLLPSFARCTALEQGHRHTSTHTYSTVRRLQRTRKTR